MTSTQLTGIYFGLIGFAVIWPMVLVVTRRRPLVTGMVTLYATLALAVVFLPLPGPDTPRPRQTIQLMPLQWVLDTARGDILAVKQMLLNVLLFVPLGILLGVLARRTLRTTVLLGFATSLMIEITQLSGNFGLAPFTYRVFDIDDLVTNTTGAALGWIVANIALTTIARKQQVNALHAELDRFRAARVPAHS
jgi:glycopeptide antibiotics resistance protein